MEDTHPLLIARAYRVRTAPVLEALRAFQDVVQTPQLGMVMMAPPRFGKTTLLVEIEERIGASKSGVVLRSTMTRSTFIANWENLFYRRLRGEEEGEVAAFPNLSPRKALIRHIQNECDKVGQKLVLFLLDEAQNLTINQLDALKSLSESLLNLGLKPFFLLVGQLELRYLVVNTKDSLRQDLVQRFMLRSHTFHGLRSEEDLRTFLKHTDETVWPAGSNCTYTQHFAPAAWAKGWRMAGEAAALWNAFKHHARTIGMSAERLELGVHFAAQAQLDLLKRVGAPLASADAIAKGEAPPPVVIGPGGEIEGRSALLLAVVEACGLHESVRMEADVAKGTDAEVLKQAKRWARGASAKRAARA